MKTKVFMAMAVLALVAAGCNNEETDNWNGEIRLTNGVAVQTRANTQAKLIQQGETVYAWVDKASTPAASYINAWTLIAEANGSLAGSSQYYPTDGSPLNFYALHGNFASGTFTEDATEFPEDGVVHSVEKDQSGTDMKNYVKSDLLYAVKKGVKRGNSAVELPFYHILSKVEVALKSGEGEPDLEGATVTIEGTKLKAEFTPSKDVAMDDPSARAGMIAIPDDDNEATPVKIRTVVTTDFTTDTDYAEAVLLPNQTIAENTPFIKVTLADDGGVFSYKISDDGGLKLESGKKYTYKITVNRSKLYVSSEIKDWDKEEKSGEATMD